MPGLLVDSQQAVLAQALIDLNIVNPTAWPINVDQEPDEPDSVITVYGTQGRDDGRTQVDGELQEHHGIMIKVRSLDRTGFTIITQLAVAMDGLVDRGVSLVTNGVTNRYNIQSISRTGNGVICLGKEMPPSRRNGYTVNAVMSVRMITNP